MLEGATRWLEAGRSQSWLPQKAHECATDLGMDLLHLDFFGLYISSSASKCSRGDAVSQAILCLVPK